MKKFANSYIRLTKTIFTELTELTGEANKKQEGE